MRKQYHLRNSGSGLLAWDIDRLIHLTSELPVFEISLDAIRELDEPFWFAAGGELPTCRKISEHLSLIQAADLSFPIILDPDGRVMDGMHRVCKALLAGLPGITAIRLPVLPPPDFTGISPEDLPYEP